MSTTIEWTHTPDGKGGRKKGETVNPQIGCEEISPGCRNCYAAKQAAREMSEQHRGLTRSLPLLGPDGKPIIGKNGKPRIKPNSTHWNGKITRVPEQLEKPLRWRSPRGIFWGSMTDLFIGENVETDEGCRFLAACFGVMAATPQHTHMVLTKRPHLMRTWFDWIRDQPFVDPVEFAVGQVEEICQEALDRATMSKDGRTCVISAPPWPLPNVWLGTTTEDQRRADERIPELLATPAAVRFLSCEPLLGPLDLHRARPWLSLLLGEGERSAWVIVGGESGPGARPMHPAWVRSLRDQCRDAGVPFFMKQMSGRTAKDRKLIPDELNVREFPHGT